MLTISSSSVVTGAPSVAPMAKADTSRPAEGIETSMPLAMLSSVPMGPNSVVPMPNAAMASAARGSAALF